MGIGTVGRTTVLSSSDPRFAVQPFADQRNSEVFPAFPSLSPTMLMP
jgi:hypothetical protein